MNLLTPQRVKKAAAEILTGEMVRLESVEAWKHFTMLLLIDENSLPLDVPEKPAFGRQPFEHKISPLVEGVAYDDTYSLNTQSGTQWDGFRHVSPLSLTLNSFFKSDLQLTVSGWPTSKPRPSTTEYTTPFHPFPL